MSDQAPGSRRSTSSSIRYTPSTTPSYTFGEERASSPSFSFDTPQSQVQTPANRTTSPPSNMTSSTPRFTPSSTPPFIFGEQRSPSPGFSFSTDGRTRSAGGDITPSASAIDHEADLDPDIPLPSVERDPVSTETSRDSTPNSVVYTPSVSMRASTGSIESRMNEDLLNLRLNSSTPLAPTEELPRPSCQRAASSATSTPSIHITPTPTPSAFGSVQPRSNRTDSLVDGISALRMDNAHPSSHPPDTDRLLGTPSPAAPGTAQSANRSPSPSRRRRSGSGAGPIIHQIEDEDPPQALARERAAQEGLTNARRITARLAGALASSALHHERESNIHSLYQEAINLSEFQVPPSRTVGLVGDSGAGKSSLINSLLDKKDLARAVCSITTPTSCHRLILSLYRVAAEELALA
jgi:hypothetical protein